MCNPSLRRIPRPHKVRQELLQHELVVEEMGGDVLAVEVSAKTRMGLDKLEEAILLQSEILELRANPNPSAVGTVVEAKLDRGRGSVATVLVQRGTLRVGDLRHRQRVGPCARPGQRPWPDRGQRRTGNSGGSGGPEWHAVGR